MAVHCYKVRTPPGNQIITEGTDWAKLSLFFFLSLFMYFKRGEGGIHTGEREKES